MLLDDIEHTSYNLTIHPHPRKGAMSDIEFSLSLPLDSLGFLRRECPTCSREFKWHADEPPAGAVSSPSQYFCPYCGVAAAPDEWFTQEQIAFIRDQTMERTVNPSLAELQQTLQDLERTSGGLIKGSLTMPEGQTAPPIFEPDDMKLIAFSCHPCEPLKIVDTWTGVVHCLICGETDIAPTG
jgi:hypothetical protein